MWNKLFSNPTSEQEAAEHLVRNIRIGPVHALRDHIYAVHAQLEGLNKVQAVRVLLFVLRDVVNR